MRRCTVICNMTNMNSCMVFVFLFPYVDFISTLQSNYRHFQEKLWLSTFEGNNVWHVKELFPCFCICSEKLGQKRKAEMQEFDS